MSASHIGPATSLREIAFIVCDAISQVGGTVVLSGGGAATIYSEDAYQSRDLDFVLALWGQDSSRWTPVLQQLGFQPQHQTFVHPNTPYTLDFQAHPLAIDREVIEEWSVLEENGRRLNILTPTDCVRDRLAWFVYNNDYSGLEQAVQVAAQQREAMDLDVIQRWFERERAVNKFEIFRQRLEREIAARSK